MLLGALGVLRFSSRVCCKTLAMAVRCEMRSDGEGLRPLTCEVVCAARFLSWRRAGLESLLSLNEVVLSLTSVIGILGPSPCRRYGRSGPART